MPKGDVRVANVARRLPIQTRRLVDEVVAQSRQPVYPVAPFSLVETLQKWLVKRLEHVHQLTVCHPVADTIRDEAEE